jgi:hypothetical protein
MRIERHIAMTLYTARLMLPLSVRMDWDGPRLSYIPRRAYGDRETWRMRLERKLKRYLASAWGSRRLY